MTFWLIGEFSPDVLVIETAYNTSDHYFKFSIQKALDLDKNKT